MNSRVRKRTEVSSSSSAAPSPKLYGELASWWPLLFPPTDYFNEAALCQQMLLDFSHRPVRRVLELGSGGGNNAYHLKDSFQLTLVDLSAEMLAVSSALNAKCEHIQGDMRTIRLGRLFDAVLIHDAIAYVTSEDDLAMVMQTSFRHCSPGGVALFVPPHVRETFWSRTAHLGKDSPGRCARCLWWTWDRNPTDTIYELGMAHVLRNEDGTVRFENEIHELGLFPRQTWLKLLRSSGFRVRSEKPDPGREVFAGMKLRE